MLQAVENLLKAVCNSAAREGLALICFGSSCSIYAVNLFLLLCLRDAGVCVGGGTMGGQMFSGVRLLLLDDTCFRSVTRKQN